jgi:hypothetical protein
VQYFLLQRIKSGYINDQEGRPTQFAFSRIGRRS